MGMKMPLMAGKQGLIMGVANERSIAWGIAKAVHGEGATLAFTHQGEALGRRVRPLALSLDSDFVLEADVASEESRDALFAGLIATMIQTLNGLRSLLGIVRAH